MSSRNQLILIGAVVGAGLGAAAAYAYIESQRRGGLFVKQPGRGRELSVQTGIPDLFKIGMATVSLIRQIQGLARPL